MDQLVEIGSRRVLKCAAEGTALRVGADANDVIGDAMSVGADLVAIPVERLGPNFLQLGTGVAGEVFQKFVNYHLTCAIVGDITQALDGSRALRDFVRETNTGGSIWFVPDFARLRARLESTGPG